MAENQSGSTGDNSVQVEPRVIPLVVGNVEIIYRHGVPKGIRDATGFLFTFSEVQRYQGQNERYKAEIDAQFALADFLLESLKKV